MEIISLYKSSKNGPSYCTGFGKCSIVAQHLAVTGKTEKILQLVYMHVCMHAQIKDIVSVIANTNLSLQKKVVDSSYLYLNPDTSQ